MAITKADILSFTNDRLRRIDTDIDESIKLVLRDLSSYYCLTDTDTSQSLTSTDLTLDYPSDALDDEQAIKSVILTDSSSVQLPPLEYLGGGWRDYNRLMQYFATGDRSYPESMVCFRRKIYLYPAPNAAYTVSIEYYKRHADTADTISYSEDWRNAIYFGACMEVAVHHKMGDQIQLWSTRYVGERDRQIMTHREDVSIVE